MRRCVSRPGSASFDRVLGVAWYRGHTTGGRRARSGKSTLLLQSRGAGRCWCTALVASAEESVAQVALRAGRLGLADAGVLVTAESDVDAIVEAADRVRPDLLVVDSVQTVTAPEAEGSPEG